MKHAYKMHRKSIRENSCQKMNSDYLRKEDLRNEKGGGAGRKEMMFYFFSFMFPIHIFTICDSFTISLY